MTHAPRCVCDACWPTRLAEMSALVAGAARRLGAELLARVAHARPARVPAMSSRVRRREDIARTNLSGPPSRPQGRRPFHGDTGHGMTPCGILLDPPYAHSAGRDKRIYREDPADVSTAVRAWALANGDHPALRIALCGWEGEHEMPSSWRCVAWRAANAWANAERERIWFSPHCLPIHGQGQLFAEAS